MQASNIKQLSFFKQLLLATSFVASVFIVQGHMGFSLWDEGFLWYGAQRVLLGEVPIRDFMAYDPGRYYWSAAYMWFRQNNGIMALREAATLFQFFGLFVGLLLITKTIEKPNFYFLLVATVTLIIWMYPRHKLFDISLSIFLIGAFTVLIGNPSHCCPVNFHSMTS